jgi:hypothetical protein
MISIEMKQRALKQLAVREGAAVERAMEKQFEKIKSIMGRTKVFEEINDHLTVLNDIGFRRPKNTLEILGSFLNRLKKIKLTYRQETMSAHHKNYYNEAYLIKKCLGIITQLRYFHPKEVLDILLEYTKSSSEFVVKQAEEGIRALSRYDLDVFFGNAEVKGLGAYPQEVVLRSINKMSDRDKKIHVESILKIFHELLSPSMEATNWKQQTITITTGNIPAAQSLKKIRAKVISNLFLLYKLSTSFETKVKVLNVLQQGTRTYRGSKSGKDQTSKMISADTIKILQFYLKLVKEEELQILEKIESDAYWLHYHRYTPAVGQATLKIKKTLDKNSEYQIFKTLIGFEGVFDEWTQKGSRREVGDVIERREKLREKNVLILARNINKENYSEWVKRIKKYSQIESNDMATFIHYTKFLEAFAASAPSLALDLIAKHREAVGRFVVPILTGIWATDFKKDAEKLIFEWTKAGYNFHYILRFYQFSPPANLQIVNTILVGALKTKDRNLLALIIAMVIGNFDTENKKIFKSIFIKALAGLTRLKEPGWVHFIWYSKKLDGFISSLSNKEIKLVLKNLLFVKKIDYHSEKLLTPIAEKAPALIMDYFVGRIYHERDKDEVYEAIPYSFDKLGAALTPYPAMAIRKLKPYKHDQMYLLHYREGKLLRLLFANYDDNFAMEVERLVGKGGNKGIELALAILRNYEDQPKIHRTIKYIVKTVPVDSERLQTLEIILESTGLVEGESGLTNAYIRKRNEIEYWLSDRSLKVRKFAERYIRNLDAMIAFEKRRIEERRITQDISLA